MASSKSKSIKEIISGPAYYFFLCLLLIISMLWVAKPINEHLIGDASMFILLIQKFLGFIQTTLVDLEAGRSIWHPLLYPSIMIAFAKLFGPDLIWQRAIGLVCLAVSFYLILKIVDLISNKIEEKRIIIIIFCGIFILVPYGLAGSVHIDIDNTVMTPTLLLFIYFLGKFLSAENKNRGRAFIFMGIAVSIGLWAKLTTPLLLPSSLFIF